MTMQSLPAKSQSQVFEQTILESQLVRKMRDVKRGFGEFIMRNAGSQSPFSASDQIVDRLLEEIQEIMDWEIPGSTSIESIKLDTILGLSNVYVEIFHNMRDSMISHIFRASYCEMISWSIISNHQELQKIKDFLGNQIVELGCGQGFISYLLSLLGCELQSVDNLESHGVSPTSFKFVPIEKADILHFKPKYRNYLVSFWPYKCDRLTQFLKARMKEKEPFRLAYIGELSGGCCGSDCLFELLDTFKEVDSIGNTTWKGIWDSITFYEWNPLPVNEDSIAQLMCNTKYLSCKSISKKLNAKKSLVLSILRTSSRFVSLGLHVVGSVKKGSVWSLRTCDDG